jgi:hypothetical protein
VDIGGALAEARSEAGLTITEVSERTRIRATIIRDIERDDYSACGGDYYARGHIRAIAKVVGTDPVPLIEEYDAAHMPPQEATLSYLAGLHPGGPIAADPRPNGPSRSGPAPVDPDADTNPDVLDGRSLEFGLPGALWPRLRDSATRWADTVRSRRAGQGRPRAADGGSETGATPAQLPRGITAAEAFRPGLPMDFERRRPRRAALLGLLVLVAIGVLIYLLVSGGSPHGPATHGAHRAAHSASGAHHGAAAAANHTSGAKPSGATSSAAVGPLAVVSAAAFGPGGTSQGDDPQAAPLAIDGRAGTSWHTAWYTTPRLGGLQSGTGLLLSLGKTSMVASATIVLGPPRGGTIELRAGNTPALASLPVVASAANPGGTLTMHVNVPVPARYVLIWFTSLPPDSSGTFQASIYDVRVSGTA